MDMLARSETFQLIYVFGAEGKSFIKHNTKRKKQKLGNKHKLQNTMSTRNTEYNTREISYRAIFKQKTAKKY